MIIENTAASFTAQVGGTANNYIWYKNGNIYTYNTTGLLSFNHFTAADTGIYNCIVTNSIVTNLTLYRYPIHIGLDTNGVKVLENNFSQITINIYPNPAKESIIISTTNNKQAEMQVYNMQGCLLHKQIFSKSTNIEIKNWTAGVYYVKLITENGIFVRKFVKEE